MIAFSKIDFTEMAEYAYKLLDGVNNKEIYITGGIVSVTAILYFVYRRFFNRTKNLPGPNQSSITGDLFDFRRHKFQLHLLLDEYVKKYGSRFSFYHQGHQVVTVTDEKIVQQILWKDFNSFENRKFFMDLPWPAQQTITMVKAPKAKMIRNLLKTVTDANSIRNIWKNIQEANVTVEKIMKNPGNTKEIDSTSLAQGYIMEILAKTAFSLDYPNQSKENNMLVKLSENFTRPPSWINILAGFPFVRKFIKYLPDAFQWKPLIDIAIGLVEARREEGERESAQDVLDALLIAQKGNHDLLTEDLLAQGVTLVTAVHVATSTTIACATYFIAKHTEIQERLQKEIGGLKSGESEKLDVDHSFPTWENVHKETPFLDQVIKEVLRLYPSGFMLMRECTKPTTIDNIRFEKGDGILIPTYSLHRDPNYFQNPDSFDPDRFSNWKPGSSHFLPFGDGYRMCIGKQMAISEMKMYFINLLKNFNIRLADETQELHVESHVTIQAMMALTEPIKIRVEERKSSGPVTP